jgi:hypothetical protein
MRICGGSICRLERAFRPFPAWVAANGGPPVLIATGQGACHLPGGK